MNGVQNVEYFLPTAGVAAALQCGRAVGRAFSRPKCIVEANALRAQRQQDVQRASMARTRSSRVGVESALSRRLTPYALSA